MSRTVVIAAIGKKHPGIPVYRPGMEVWGINDAPQHCPEIRRFYKIYNIHKDFPECIDNLPGRYKDWRRKYESSKALVVTAKDLGLPKQRVLDITKMREDNPDYIFCSTISYMIFEAVQMGYDEIRLYRLSLNHDEYRTQGWGIIQNIQWAMDRGVKVYWPWLKFIRANFLYDKSATPFTYGERDINMQYGESNAVDKCKVDTSLWTAGDALYLSQTSGSLTNVKPVEVRITSYDDMTVGQIKVAIKARGGKIPKGRANKAKLKDILKSLR